MYVHNPLSVASVSPFLFSVILYLCLDATCMQTCNVFFPIVNHIQENIESTIVYKEFFYTFSINVFPSYLNVEISRYLTNL